ncbi:MAG: type II secretion system F family protein [Planctomycetes bacterium]|nr:type II secretion system F family protein [Planctomycetota bacterium]
MTLYITAVLLVVAIGMVTYSLWPKASQDDEAIKRRMTGRSAQAAVASVRQQAKESVAKRVMQSVAPIAVRPVMVTSAEEMSKLRMKLANAGFRGEGVATTFLASKTVVAICLAIAGGAYAWAKGDPLLTGLGKTLLGAGIGFMAPNLWLRMATGKRQDVIRKGLPDTLDMLVISVESGLGLDAAFQRVGDEMRNVHPALAEELQLITLESQMGIPRAEALNNFAVRTGIEESRSLVGVVNQAERFGTSISSALRRQSEALRTKRRQAAEERAQKTTVKLLLPLIMFIFPAILVVLAGPAALKMIDTLGAR